MLILSRKTHEKIDIGTTVTVTVLEIRGGRVKLGIDAPDGLIVHRREVTVAIQREKTLRELADEADNVGM